MTANTQPLYDWNRVEELLTQRDMSKSQLACDLGIDRKNLYLYRNGDAPFTARTAMAIAYVLGISVDELRADG